MDWMDFDRWPECLHLERPGIVFEVMNAEGLSVLTTCTVPLEIPAGWTSPPLRFRPVPEPAPGHSQPLPPPASGG
ncbi:MAG: hypothetical protein JWQ89_2852 [Devosia sp.]|uniref:hypothetical protein n=1 Tax=Devosia sp. TaxID=1871048 RepID=UPI002617A3D4|nr:hypothetical protein [Devosia sp.]MDB5541125.1 hypothetical protein [Devosia sp.]